VSRAPLAARLARELDGMGLAEGTWLVAVSGGSSIDAGTTMATRSLPTRLICVPR